MTRAFFSISSVSPLFSPPRARAPVTPFYTPSPPFALARPKTATPRSRSCTKYRHIICANIHASRIDLFLSFNECVNYFRTKKAPSNPPGAPRIDSVYKTWEVNFLFAQIFSYVFSRRALSFFFSTSEKTHRYARTEKSRERYAGGMDLVIGKERLASLFGNVSLRGRSPSDRRARSSRFSNPVIRFSMSSVPWATISFAHTQAWPRWTPKKPNPVYQPTDPPSPPLVTYSVTADDQDDFDSLLVRPSSRERQRCIKVMIYVASQKKNT